MKIVILGGSAPGTPALWSYLNKDRREGLHVVLMGRHAERLHAVRRACHMLTEANANQFECHTLDDLTAWKSLEDTRIFLIQIRNGGHEARAVDETFPLEYGVCGDEGLGPGGLCAGIRNWRILDPLLKQISLTAPEAHVVLMSSPVSLLVRAARRAFPALRVSGICELPWTTLLKIGAALRLPVNGIQFDYLGVNHLGWFHRLEFDGTNLIERYANVCVHPKRFPSAEIIRACGAIPLAHLKLHYEPYISLDHQRKSGRPRGKILAEWSKKAFDIYATGTRDDIEQILKQRPTPWYRYAIGPFIGFTAGQLPSLPFFLSVPNCDMHPQFEPGDILEWNAHGRFPWPAANADSHTCSTSGNGAADAVRPI